MTYSDIKMYLGREDLVSLLEALGYEFTRQGSFNIRDEKTPSVTIRLGDLHIKDHGGDFSGDIFDLLKELHGMTAQEGKNYVMNFLGLSNGPNIVPSRKKVSTLPKPSTVKQTVEEENILIHGLEQMAARCLTAYPGKKWSSFTLQEEDAKGVTIDQSIIWVDPMFEKLFEGQLIPADERFAKYLFDKIIGYDSYFNCPMIIVRDEAERVVDIVKYRPERNGIPLEQKYLVAGNEYKPHKRGRNFVFPFQQQMMKIMKKEGYCYVGEGLKNVVNASMMGIPFISIESSSGIENKLIEFLKSPRINGIKLIGAMDGDESGERAYKKLHKEIYLSKNIFDFNSGIDFTDYLKSIHKEELYGSKKAS